MNDRIWLYIRVSRPVFWLPGPLAVLAGMITGMLESPGSPHAVTWIMVAQLVSLSFPLALFTFGINDLYDSDSDAMNPRKNSGSHLSGWVEGSTLAPDNHRAVKKGIFVSGICMAAASLATGNPDNMVCTLSLLVLVTTYSMPPWRLKSRAPLDSVSCGLAASLLPMAIGFTYTGRPVWDLPFNLFVFSVCAMGFHSLTTVMDHETDQAHDNQTFSVRFGRRAAGAMPLAGTGFALCFLQSRLLRFSALACLAITCAVVIHPGEKTARIAFIGIYLIIIMTAIIWTLRYL